MPRPKKPQRPIKQRQPKHSSPGFLAKALYEPEELDQSASEDIQAVIGNEKKIHLLAYSDLLHSGVYGTSCLVVTSEELIFLEEVRPEGEPSENEDPTLQLREASDRIPLNQIQSVSCQDYVGNGVLSVRLNSGKHFDLVRYSRTLSESFEEASIRINQLIQADEETLEAHKEQTSNSNSPQDSREASRCSKCGHPIQFQSDPCPKCSSKRAAIWRICQFLFAHWPLLLAGSFTSLLVVAINITPPILVRLLIDKVLVQEHLVPEMRMVKLYIIVAIFLGLISVRAVIQFIRINVMGRLAGNVVRDLRRKVYRSLQRLSLNYYEREHTGRIMSRVLNDTGNVQGFVVGGLQQILIHSIMVIAIPIIMLQQNWQLGLIALAPIPVAAVMARFFSKRFKSTFRTLKRRIATLSAAISDTVTGIRVVKSFAQESRECETFDRKIDSVYNAQLTAAETRSRFNPTVMFIITTGTLVVWLVGGRWVITGMITVGLLIQFISYMNQLYNPVQQLLALTEMFQQTATSAERVFTILDMPSEIGDNKNSQALENVQGDIRFEDCSFGYQEGERVLKNINLEIKPGEMLGLVGKTGSGKSTLASLVCRFYDPTRGRVLLDGQDLRDIKVKSLRQNLGMVLQQTYLFGGTIRDNINYGKPDASPLEIVNAAKAANAHDFIMNLPDGYDTEVGEAGNSLSGGERQRIAIARAILKDPAILILDEATSAVDTATEQSIQGAMDRLVKGRTTIAIAHRLSTLRNADKLIVMDNGEILEYGTHDELMKRDGEYAKLCKIQASFAKDVAV